MVLFRQQDNTTKRPLKFKKIRICWRKCPPIFYVKKSNKSIVNTAFYVDDNLMVGDVVTIDVAIEALQENGLVLKSVKWIKYYLSCQVRFPLDWQDGLVWTAFSHQKLGKKCRDQVKKVQTDTSRFKLLGIWLLMRRFLQRNKKVLIWSWNATISHETFQTQYCQHDQRTIKVNDGTNH